MEAAEDDEDLKLVRASASLLADLELALPKILWKRSKGDNTYPKVHTRVRRQDLDHVVKLIEPFQGEPQLLDAKLKHILPPLVDAYLRHISAKSISVFGDHVALENAICILLYTICKVRGYKIVLQFLSNEPRYLEPILARLEAVLSNDEENPPDWQVSYILLLWLSHLLLTPFDLSSLSDPREMANPLDGILNLQQRLPSLAERVLIVGLKCLSVPTKAQDAAALLLVRFVTRPDMQKLSVANAVVDKMFQALAPRASDVSVAIYEQLGPLRFLAGVCAAPELATLVPEIYRTCETLAQNETSAIVANAVAKKLMVKIFRNIAILSLRPLPAQNPLRQFAETTSILEDVVDYSLRSLGDRDTPVRYAAAKALSLIILRLEPEMGHEVIQAILDSFQEDMPESGKILDFENANALKWHGLTLALAHTLFKRSASPRQLLNIVRVLCSALQFEQRTATGSTVGTNVRDAANFGIWSLSRRYTTQELRTISVLALPGLNPLEESQIASQHLHGHGSQSVIQYLAVQLILSACLDPAGNIRRGSSAALQELIGRHPNEVYEGIALVQIIDYQSVGLRRRAMLDVANRAAKLHITYWASLVEAIFGWRALGASDAPSRDAAAASIARLSSSNPDTGYVALMQVVKKLREIESTDLENLHGLVLALACVCEEVNLSTSNSVNGYNHQLNLQLNELEASIMLDKLLEASSDFSLRLLRSELPSATIRLIAALCLCFMAGNTTEQRSSFWNDADHKVEKLIERMLTRHEDTITQALPSLVVPLVKYKQTLRLPLGCLEAEGLCKRIASDSTKSTLHGAGRVIALGTLVPWYENGLTGDKARAAIDTLEHVTSAPTVDWRVIAVKALQLAVEGSLLSGRIAEPRILESIVNATHWAMNDYTIDERGDVGSLVRLQGISCTVALFRKYRPIRQAERFEVLEADIHRLSLEKLDRVRLAAAQCLHDHLGFEAKLEDFASVSSQVYFDAVLRPLADNAPAWKHQALLQGVTSCAGISAEPLLQASRAALSSLLSKVATGRLQGLLSMLADTMKYRLTDDTNNMHAAIELLAFLLDMQIPQRLADSSEGVHFKWRNLLSTVQKSHHKSNDVPKILAAVHVYRWLVEIPTIRLEVMKKLVSMLRTNPYPRVRMAVAEALFVITQEPAFKERDWLKPASQNLESIQALEKKYLIETMPTARSVS